MARASGEQRLLIRRLLIAGKRRDRVVSQVFLGRILTSNRFEATSVLCLAQSRRLPLTQIETKSLDRVQDTWIKVGCHRETHRLDRVLETFQKALTLADAGGNADAFASSVISMHDQKGWLTVEWVSVASGQRLHSLIDKAWQDFAEPLVTHVAVSGEHIAGERT